MAGKNNSSKTKKVAKTSTKSSSPVKETKSSVTVSEKKGLPVFVRFVLAAAIFLALGYLLRGLLVAAIVNGQPIYRLSVIQDLEKQGGSQVLSNDTTKIVILQAMQKQNITVSQKELNDELKKVEDDIKKQGGNLDQMLALQGETRDTYMERLKIQIMAQKLFAKDIKVTDKEVDDVMASQQQKDALQITDESSMTPDQERTLIRTRLEQQKLSTKFQTWLADQQKRAQIIKFVNY